VHAIPDFADKLLFVSFQQNKPIGLFSTTVYEYALHSKFQVKTHKIDSFYVKIGCPSYTKFLTMKINFTHCINNELLCFE